MLTDIEIFLIFMRGLSEECVRQQYKTTLVPIQLPNNFSKAFVSLYIATLPWSVNGFRSILLITDMFSKFIEVVPIEIRKPDQLSTL